MIELLAGLSGPLLNNLAGQMNAGGTEAASAAPTATAQADTGSGISGSQALGQTGKMVGRVGRMARAGHEYWLRNKVSEDLAEIEQDAATLSLVENAMKNQRFLNRLETMRGQEGAVSDVTGPDAQAEALKKRSRYGKDAKRLAELTGGDLATGRMAKRGARTKRQVGRGLAKRDISMAAKELLGQIGVEERESAQQDRLQDMVVSGMKRQQAGKRSVKRFERERQGAWAAGLSDILSMLGG